MGGARLASGRPGWGPQEARLRGFGGRGVGRVRDSWPPGEEGAEGPDSRVLEEETRALDSSVWGPGFLGPEGGWGGGPGLPGLGQGSDSRFAHVALSPSSLASFCWSSAAMSAS